MSARVGAIDQLITFASRGVDANDYAVQLIQSAVESVDAIRELIEADMEFDEAERAYYDPVKVGDSRAITVRVNRYSDARARRATALAALNAEEPSNG